jgi:uncharacterized OsmC-like protein
MAMTPQEIRTALERAAKAVTLKPEFGQRVYVNTAVVEDGLTCRMHEKQHVLTADLPPAMGGNDRGPSPVVLMRAALSSCVAMGIKMWAARKGVDVGRIEVRVETDVDARGQFGVAEDIAPGFEDMRFHIHVDSAADQKAVQDVIDTSLRFSPLVDAMQRTQSINTQVSFGQRILERQ